MRFAKPSCVKLCQELHRVITPTKNRLANLFLVYLMGAYSNCSNFESFQNLMVYYFSRVLEFVQSMLKFLKLHPSDAKP